VGSEINEIIVFEPKRSALPRTMILLRRELTHSTKLLLHTMLTMSIRHLRSHRQWVVKPWWVPRKVGLRPPQRARYK
jgi:hypothetical protein